MERYENAVLEIATQQVQNNIVDDVAHGIVGQLQEQRDQGKQRRQGSAAFFTDLNDSDSDEEENNPEPTAEAIVDAELQAYKLDKGCSMQKEDGSYACPLVWWQLHHSKFPSIWKLAIRILAIPATSAPAKRVFSAAANAINKKRVRLKPETVDLLIFLRRNKEFVRWD